MASPEEKSKIEREAVEQYIAKTPRLEYSEKAPGVGKDVGFHLSISGGDPRAVSELGRKLAAEALQRIPHMSVGGVSK